MIQTNEQRPFNFDRHESRSSLLKSPRAKAEKSNLKIKPLQLNRTTQKLIKILCNQKRKMDAYIEDKTFI